VATAGGIVTHPTSFVVLPAIVSFLPLRGFPGAAVKITGTSLGGATKVEFNHIPSTFTGTSTTIMTSVPSAATKGRITVTTPDGTASSAADFEVLNTPIGQLVEL